VEVPVDVGGGAALRRGSWRDALGSNWFAKRSRDAAFSDPESLLREADSLASSRKAQNPEAVLDAYRLALEAASGFYHKVTRAEIHSKMAAFHEKQENPEAALRAYRLALEAASGSDHKVTRAKIHSKMAAFYEKQDKPHKASKAYQTSLALYEQILKVGYRGEVIKPLIVNISYSLGQSFIRAARHAESIKYLRRAVELDPYYEAPWQALEEVAAALLSGTKLRKPSILDISLQLADIHLASYKIESDPLRVTEAARLMDEAIRLGNAITFSSKNGRVVIKPLLPKLTASIFSLADCLDTSTPNQLWRKIRYYQQAIGFDPRAGILEYRPPLFETLPTLTDPGQKTRILEAVYSLCRTLDTFSTTRTSRASINATYDSLRTIIDKYESR
jgi:tetratricopeptide (TPR) repeat protein